MCTPLFYQSYFLEEEFKNNSCFVKIRYPSRFAYLKQMLSSFLIFSIFYILFLFITVFLESIMISLISSLLLHSENSGLFSMAFSTDILKALFLKCLELYMVLLLSLTITIYTRKASISFLLIIGGYSLNIFGFTLNKYNPFGLSSTIRWGMETNYQFSFSSALFILCIANMILLTFLALKGQQKII